MPHLMEAPWRRREREREAAGTRKVEEALPEIGRLGARRVSLRRRSGARGNLHGESPPGECAQNVLVHEAI